MGDPMRPKLTSHEQLFVFSLAAALMGPFPGANQGMFLLIALDRLASVDGSHYRIGPLVAAATAVRAYGDSVDPLRPLREQREDHNMALLDLRQKLGDFFGWRAGLLQDAMAQAGDNVRGVAE